MRTIFKPCAMMRRLAPVFTVFALAACAATSPPGRPDFEAALARHLAAITAKDIDAYAPTITSGEDMTLIFPDGDVMLTRDVVEGFHRAWFEDPDWRMEFERVRIVEGADMALALVRTRYRDTPDGEPRDAYLALVFRLEDGAWRLVHDQNTRIPAEAAGE